MTRPALGASLDAVLSCLETNGLLVDRALAVRSGIEAILKSIDPGAFLGINGDASGVNAGITQAVQAVEYWPEDIAYVKIGGLIKGSGEEIMPRLQSLTHKSGIIVDLRGATGDDLGSVSCLAGLAHPNQAPLYILMDNQGRSLSTNVVGSGATLNVPLMVLIDSGTRSAAEALVAVLRGRPGIMLIGTATHGDARFRDPVTLPDGQVITLATRRLVPMNGGSYEGCGVSPDVLVPTLGDKGNGTLFDTNAPQRALSAKSERDRDLMRRVDKDAVLRRATDIILGLRTLGGYGQ